MQIKIVAAPYDIAHLGFFLNTILDFEHELYSKIRMAYRNAELAGVEPKRMLYREQYCQLEEIICDIEKQIYQLGYFHEISLTGFLVLKFLKEIANEQKINLECMKYLLKDHELIIGSFKKIRISIL